MHPGTRWPLVGLGLGLCLSVLCWMECEASYQSWWLAYRGTTPPSYYSSMKQYADSRDEGLDRYEYSILGITIEEKRDWWGYRPTEHSGLPGGRWSLYTSVLIVCILLGCLPLLFDRPRKVETT